MDYVAFDTLTGEIITFGSCPPGQLSAQTRHGTRGVLEGQGQSHTHYVVNTEIVERPLMGATINKNSISADNIDAAIVSNIPNGTQYKVRGYAMASGEINDGVFSLTTDTPGVYEINLFNFPYQDAVFLVTAT